MFTLAVPGDVVSAEVAVTLTAARWRGRWRGIQPIFVNCSVSPAARHRPSYGLAAPVVHDRRKLLLGCRGGPRISRLISIDICQARTHSHRHLRRLPATAAADPSTTRHQQKHDRPESAPQRASSTFALSTRNSNQHNARHRNGHQPCPTRGPDPPFFLEPTLELATLRLSCTSSLSIRSHTPRCSARRRNRYCHRRRSRSRRNRP